MSKYTTQDFVEKSIQRYGEGAFDYSLVCCNGAMERVTLICKKGHKYTQRANNHLAGIGCPECAKIRVAFSHRRLIHGVGLFDGETGESSSKIYDTWRGMIDRCYSHNKKYNPYKDCTVCEEWHVYSNFKRWFEDPANGYRDGYQLDKDIISQGCRLYSPDTCCFLPPEINTIFSSAGRRKGALPYGVRKSPNAFAVDVKLTYNGIPKRTYIGGFSSPHDAFAVYKQIKESHIKKIANDYYSNGLISKRAYDGLMNYEVKEYEI